MKLSCRLLLTAIAALGITEPHSTAIQPQDRPLLQGDGTPGGRLVRVKDKVKVGKEDLVQADPSTP